MYRQIHSWKALCLAALLTVVSANGFCQSLAGGGSGIVAPPRDAADSADLARNAYREAVRAFNGRDTTGALKYLGEAALAWPNQPYYADMLLGIAAVRRDTGRVRTALMAARAINVSLKNSSADELRSLSLSAETRKLLDQQSAIRAPLTNSSLLVTLPDSALFPEGITTDPRTGTLYVSSIYRRNVFAVASSGEMTPLLKDETPGVGAIFGLAIDTVRNVVWGASLASPLMQHSAAGDSVGAALVAISLSGGQLAKRLPLPVSIANASPGDLVVAPNGDVFVSDAQAGVLWWRRGNADTLIAIRHRLFRSLQGIVPGADGSTVWVADYAYGILRVELSTGVVTRVADLRGHTTIGLDGVVNNGRRNGGITMIAIQNGVTPARVLRITLDASGRRVVQQTTLDQHALATSPTNGTLMNGAFVYVANSLWEGVAPTGTLRHDAPHPRPVLLRLDLRN